MQVYYQLTLNLTGCVLRHPVHKMRQQIILGLWDQESINKWGSVEVAIVFASTNLMLWSKKSFLINIGHSCHGLLIGIRRFSA